MATRELNLPPGHWIAFNDLPAGVTAEELREFFLTACGLDLPLENIHVFAYQRVTNFTVSIPKEILVDWLAWSLSEVRLRGRQIQPCLAKSAKW